MKKKWVPNNQRGAIAVIFVVLLVVFIGFAALAIDAGMWYLEKEEIKEATDAAAMAGVQAYGFSASGTCTEWKILAEDVLKENFHDGYLGCQLSDEGIVIDDSRGPDGQLRVEVTACANCTTFFAGIFGIDTVRVCASEERSVAERIPAEIMLVLDRSDSMGGRMFDLRDAAKSFADHFKCTQEVDRMGLISYATGVMVDFELQNNFITNEIKTKIGEITIRDSVGDKDTNMEDAIDQADDETDRCGNSTITFTDQSGLPANQRVKQFLVFFTAGKADSFRDIFTQDNNDYDAVIPDPDDVGWLVVGCLRDPYDGTSMGVDFKPTGDGKPEAVSACGNTTTEWHVFEDYPIAGYSSPYCDISDSPLRGYVLDTAKKMTIYHAGKLKEQGIIIYCIGLGIVDGTFLKEDISSWDPAHPEEEYYFKAPSSSEMKRIFNQVAMEIKKYVYLVQ